MAQKLRKHGKKLEKTSVGCRIDFTILLSMLKVNLKIIRNISMKLGTLIKHDEMMCHAKEP